MKLLSVRIVFLYDYQKEAVTKMKNGCILNGGVGSGKSRTGLYYYFTQNGGQIEPKYKPMVNTEKLYIITTAAKRDKREWEEELIPFLLANDGKNVVVDSWNNIKKYADVTESFFIFDEDRVTGSGIWVKTFLKIARSNHWIILSATPGDTWEQYIPVFVANGFYRNKSDFVQQHVQYSQFTSYPKIERYLNQKKLMRLRGEILIDMNYDRPTVPHHIDINCEYDILKYKTAMKKRWDPFKDEPIQQASSLCYILRRISNENPSRADSVLKLAEEHPRLIVFYNFDYELDILRKLDYANETAVAEWNGHQHDPIPKTKRWIYLVQYTAGCEGWNSTETDTIIFYSQNYSYKVMTQAAGRIDRLNTSYTDLYFYHLKSHSSIDLAIHRSLSQKKQFNEKRWVDSWK